MILDYAVFHQLSDHIKIQEQEWKNFSLFDGSKRIILLPDRLHVVPGAGNKFVFGLAMKFFAPLLLGSFSVATLALGQGFTPGSIDGQNGWNGGVIPISSSVNQQVVSNVSATNDGSGAFQISNNTSSGNYNGNFGGWVFGPSLSVSAGYAGSGAGANGFQFTLKFRSVGTVADGSNLEFDFGSSARNDRNTFVALTNFSNAGGGFSIRASGPDAAGNFPATTIAASNIDRTTWHTLTVTGSFQGDGTGAGGQNDTFVINLDGADIGTFTTFASFFQAPPADPYVLTDNLFLRSGRAPSDSGAFNDADAGGFLIDEVTWRAFSLASPNVDLASYSTNFALVPEPGSVLAGIGAFICVAGTAFRRVRRNRASVQIG